MLYCPYHPRTVLLVFFASTKNLRTEGLLFCSLVSSLSDITGQRQKIKGFAYIQSVIIVIHFFVSCITAVHMCIINNN